GRPVRGRGSAIGTWPGSGGIGPGRGPALGGMLGGVGRWRGACWVTGRLGLIVVVMGGCVFFFRAADGIRGRNVTGVQTCALPILRARLCSKFEPDASREGNSVADGGARPIARSTEGVMSDQPCHE